MWKGALVYQSATGDMSMETRNVLSVVVLAMEVIAGSVTGVWASDNDADSDWQQQMLFEPTNEQLQLEKLGQVMIYAGIKSADIDLAMDLFNDRIENMMFVQTVWTNDYGEPLIDPYTGETVFDGDC